MPPVRRARRSSRPYCSVTAASSEPCSGRGWLSAPSKRARRIEDDGTPLTDEILVGIFARLPDLADLVRCAGTCRRWRRLVSGEAAFISRASRRTRGVFVRSLALGLFYTRRHGAVPRFAPTATAPSRLSLLRQPSINALVDDLDDGLFDSSRPLASRKGLLVVELKHRKHVLKLCVCNPMTGEVTVLPPLSGKESIGQYACTVLTADDDNSEQSSSSYRLVIVYTRRTFTACRSYWSDDGAWGPEAKVSTASVPTYKQMAAMTGAGVVVGNVVYWHARTKVFGLDLDTMQAEYVDMPVNGLKTRNPTGNTLLSVSPDGRLRIVQVAEQVSAGSTERSVAISINTRCADATSDGHWEPQAEVIPLAQWLPAGATCVRLRWAGENSGVVFFTAGYGDQGSHTYELNLDKKEVQKVASHGSDPLNLLGYEMDQRLYLASLALDQE